jgi:hypothetical protein
MNAPRTILITIGITALCLAPAYCAPKEDKEQNRGQERSDSVRAAHQHENHRGIAQGAQRNLLRQEQTRDERSRWWYNPNDDRGQGNMGNVTMLDPYGHDKTSDRKALYGNNGRVIRTEPAPEPPPELPPDPTPDPPPEPEPTPDPNPEPPPNYPPF